jgi:hypothetical protein
MKGNNNALKAQLSEQLATLNENKIQAYVNSLITYDSNSYYNKALD